jgi:archaellum component FlaF (FlaF/FlaG flagellin family)
VGGSVSIAALIVGTTLLGIFALASLSLSESTKQAAEAGSESIHEPEIRLINASESSGIVNVNITNTGSETISFDHLWLSIDGDAPIRTSSHYNLTLSLFPGETQHLTLTGTGANSPSRISAACFGAHSAVAFT